MHYDTQQHWRLCFAQDMLRWLFVSVIVTFLVYYFIILSRPDTLQMAGPTLPANNLSPSYHFSYLLSQSPHPNLSPSYITFSHLSTESALSPITTYLPTNYLPTTPSLYRTNLLIPINQYINANITNYWVKKHFISHIFWHTYIPTDETNSGFPLVWKTWRTWNCQGILWVWKYRRIVREFYIVSGKIILSEYSFTIICFFSEWLLISQYNLMDWASLMKNVL